MAATGTDVVETPVVDVPEEKTPELVDNREHPRFDFSDIGKGWRRRWTHTVMAIAKAYTVTGIEAPEGAPEDTVRQWIAAKLEAFEAIEELEAERDGLLAQVLVDVPESWLIKDAPKNLDWSDAASQDYILAARFDQVIAAAATFPSEEAKN
jgi:hypothetical protein